jgi:hypothetical protein
MFYIGTAGARKFGRGDTITDLHCSEVAFWENAKELTAGLLLPDSFRLFLAQGQLVLSQQEMDEIFSIEE